MNLGGGQTVKSLPTMSSSAFWKSTDSLSDRFPAGLRVLLVDDDPTCLMILEKMLEKCLYEVTTISRAEIALSLLQKNKNGYDIVISDVHMPDMDGFKLLECVGLEMDLPVIMMSADDSKSVVMNGVTHGACDYLIKPVRMEALKNIWQHVVRKRKHEWKDFEPVGSAEDGDRQQKPAEDAEYSSSANEGNWKSSKRKKDEEDETEEREDSSTLKKPRVVWSVELHQQFVAAVNQLGIDKAVPKKILELMNIPGLTRENVASHLQKYRLYLRRISAVSQQQSGLNNSFMGTPDANFVPLSSFNGLDFQALSATGQIPAQGLATLQAAALGRSTSKSISIPLVDQRNLFSFETPKVGFREEQQQLDNNGKQINLLHEIPINMEPKHLSNLHQYVPSYGDINMHVNSLRTQSSSLPLQMAQSQSRTQILNETNNGNLSRLSSSVEQSVVPNEIGIGVSGHNVMVDCVRGTVYNQVSHPSPMKPMVDFSMNHCADLRGSSFPLGSNPGMTTSSSKGVLQKEVSSKMKGSMGYFPSYDIFGGFQQHVSQEWHSQNVRRSFDASQHANANIQGPLDISQSVHPGLYSNQRDIQNNDMYTGKEVFSTGEQSACVNTSNANQQLSALVSGNFQRVKAENLPNTRAQNTLLPQQFGQDDLMSALLKLQERIGPVESEYCFDGYHLDNLPV